MPMVVRVGRGALGIIVPPSAGLKIPIGMPDVLRRFNIFRPLWERNSYGRATRKSDCEEPGIFIAQNTSIVDGSSRLRFLLMFFAPFRMG